MSSNRMSMRASTGESGMRVLPEMFKHRLLQLAEETVESLQKIWKEAGYEEIECQRLLGDLLTKMKTTCSAELAAEQQILEHAKKEIEDNIEELKGLSAQLGRTANVEHLSKMHCTDKLAELEKLINGINTEVSQRQKLLNTELTAIKDLVDVLGESFPSMDMFSGPEGTPELSDVRLDLMREYKGELESIKTKRSEEVRSIAKDCKPHVADLMLMSEGFSTMPEASTFVDIDAKLTTFMKTGDAPFSIFKKDIVALSKRLKSFIEEKERRREELTKTGAEIARLWSLLRVPQNERDAFQGSFKMNLSVETVTKGQNELKRLRELRSASIGKVVGSIRQDILCLWEEVGVTTDENRAREFPLYFAPTDDMEDSAVDEHEAYFNSLRVKVEELKPILQKVARRETVVQERIELEHLQMNPERLTARGPNAREERKREEGMSTRVRNLEKNTKELVATVTAWEEANGPFMYGGERYFDRITRQEESYIETRDGLRNARKKKDGKLDLAPGPAAPLRSTSATVKKTMATPGKTKSTTAAPDNTLSDANIALLNQQLAASYASTNGSEKFSNAENVPARESNASNNSDETLFTSATEVKERPSTATVVKNHYL